MSALPPKADICSAPAHVRYGPEADIPLVYSITSSARPRSDSGTVSPSTLAVLRFRISSTWSLAALALENPAGVDASQAECICNTASVAHKTTGRREPAIMIDRGHRVAGCQRSELLASARKKQIGADHQSVRPQLGQGCEGIFDIAFGAGVQDMEL